MEKKMEKFTGGKCVVCSGEIVEVIVDEWDDLNERFQEVSKGFYCKKCGLKYAFVPKGIEEKEKCVVCGKETQYFRNTPIDKREHYVEGVGQVCEECAIE